MQPSRVLKQAILAGLLTLPAACGPRLSQEEAPNASPARHIHDPRILSIASDVESIRGLRFRGKIRCASMEPWEIRELLIGRMREETDIRSIIAMEGAFKKLGLLDQDDHLPASMEALLSAKVKGLYDADTNVLCVSDDAMEALTPPDLETSVPVMEAAMSDFLVAHELTHALQDCHFNFEKLVGRTSNDDMSMALKALIEGDAIRTGIALIEGRYGDKVAGTNLLEESILERLTPKTTEHGEIPELLSSSISFPYVHGAAFVEAARAVHGWKSVNRLYRKPPQSTEQILHPERFFENPDPPIPVSPPDLGGILGDRWQRTWTGVLGELNIRTLLGRHLGEVETIRSATGWGGDILSAYENKADSRVLVTWITRWDYENDGIHFFDAWQNLVRNRYRDVLERDEINDRVALLQVHGDIFMVERRGADVVAIIGVPSRLTGAVLAHIWEGLD